MKTASEDYKEIHLGNRRLATRAAKLGFTVRRLTRPGSGSSVIEVLDLKSGYSAPYHVAYLAPFSVDGFLAGVEYARQVKMPVAE